MSSINTPDNLSGNFKYVYDGQKLKDVINRILGRKVKGKKIKEKKSE